MVEVDLPRPPSPMSPCVDRQHFIPSKSNRRPPIYWLINLGYWHPSKYYAHKDSRVSVCKTDGGRR